MSVVTDWPVRTCPFLDCKAVWIEDPVMYEDTTRCPHCGRYGDDFDYGPDQELGEVPGGSSKTKLFLHYMTSGIMPFAEGGWIKTAGALREEEYRT